MNRLTSTLNIDINIDTGLPVKLIGRIHYGIALMGEVKLTIRDNDKVYRYQFFDGKLLTALDTQQNPYEKMLDLARYADDWDGLYAYPLTLNTEYDNGKTTIDCIRDYLQTEKPLYVYLGRPKIDPRNVDKVLTEELIIGQIVDTRGDLVVCKLLNMFNPNSPPFVQCNTITMLMQYFQDRNIPLGGFVYLQQSDNDNE